MDKFEQLMRSAQYALVLLANEVTGDWELIEPQTIPTDAARTYSERGLSFGGVLAWVDGNPRAALAVELDDAAIACITQESARRFARMVTHPRWCMAPVMQPS